MKASNFFIFAIAILALTISCKDYNRDKEGLRTDTAAGERDTSVSARDEDFVTDVLESNAREIAWLNRGLNSGTDKELKSQAQQMLADHEKLGNELVDYAKAKNISVPRADTVGVVDLFEKTGREWDEEWADELGDEHQLLIKRFERAQNRVNNELNNIINKTLPTLRTHLDICKRLEERLDKAD